MQIDGSSSYIGCIIQAGNELWAAGYNGNDNLGLGHSNSTNNTFKQILGVSGTIAGWNPFGHDTSPVGGLAFCTTMGALMPAGRIAPTAKLAHATVITRHSKTNQRDFLGGFHES